MYRYSVTHFDDSQFIRRKLLIHSTAQKQCENMAEHNNNARTHTHSHLTINSLMSTQCPPDQYKSQWNFHHFNCKVSQRRMKWIIFVCHCSWNCASRAHFSGSHCQYDRLGCMCRDIFLFFHFCATFCRVRFHNHRCQQCDDETGIGANGMQISSLLLLLFLVIHQTDTVFRQ